MYNDAEKIIKNVQFILKEDIEQITSIPEMLFFGCKNLKLLEFEKNQISVIPLGVFSQCPALILLKFKYNQLAKIPDGLFDNCCALKMIDFSYNELAKIPDGLFNNCFALTHIYFGNNKLAEIPESLFDNCPALENIDFSNNELAKIPDGLFNNCCALNTIDFNNNQLAEIPESLFDNCPALENIYFSNNQLAEIPESLFDNCPTLKNIYFSNNQLAKIPDGLFNDCCALVETKFNNNQLVKIPDGLFNNCPALSEVDFSNNQLAKTPDSFFNNCPDLLGLKFNNNQLAKIPDGLFNFCPALKNIDFSNNQLAKIPDGLFNNFFWMEQTKLEVITFYNNQLAEIPDGLFNNCPALVETKFNNNQLVKIPDGLFNNCPALSEVDFSNNQLAKIPDSFFNNCPDLLVIKFNNNQLAKIPVDLFCNCYKLNSIDFGDNRIKTFDNHLFSRCGYLRFLNLERNNIEAVFFRSLEPLSNCSEINLTGNCVYNSKTFYSLMFCQFVFQYKYNILYGKHIVDLYLDKYTHFDIYDREYYIVRYSDNSNAENYYSNVEKYFLAFYLSSSSKNFNSIKSVQSKFSRLFKGNFLVSEFSLLDLFISVFGEIDDSKIIGLKKHIDRLILKDNKLVNIEFLIRSEKSIRKLCTRNIACHFQTFFPNTFYELISRVRKTNTFNIALTNKNLEIAKFIVTLLRYYVMVWSDFKNVFWTKYLTDSERAECSKRAQDALNYFNQNLFDKFEYIFEKENHLDEIVMFLMDIKQLDQLKPDQSKRKFLEYDLDRYNSNQTDSACCIETHKGGKKRKEFLVYLWQIARDNDEILKHQSVKQIFTEKWHEKAAIKYYFGLLMFIVFVVFYNIYMELDGKSYPNVSFLRSTWYISLILAVINLILEVFQCMMHVINRKFIQYITRYAVKIGGIYKLVRVVKDICLRDMSMSKNVLRHLYPRQA